MKKLLLLLTIFLAAVAQAGTYTPSSVPNPKNQGQDFYLSNPDGIISEEYETYINDLSKNLYAKTLVEIATVALESIGDMDAFDFSYELFQRWGIGGKGKNTGVLVLFVMESHDIRIMTGTGIEGVLTDAVCSQIIRTQMVPCFRDGEYEKGLLAGLGAIYQTCTDDDVPEELQSVVSVTNRGQYAEEDNEDEEESWWLPWSVIIAILLGILILNYFASIKRCPKCNKKKARPTRTQTLVYATYSHGGQEKVTYTCKHCGHVFTVIEDTPKLRDSSSSSSGGGYRSGGHSSGGSWGGGSTSGGGAGSKW